MIHDSMRHNRGHRSYRFTPRCILLLLLIETVQAFYFGNHISISPHGRSVILKESSIGEGNVSEADEFDKYGEGQKYAMSLQLSPLIGGPKFLPLHSSIILRSLNANEHYGKDGGSLLVDFVPRNPTDPLILGRLMSMKDVEGVVRMKSFSTLTEKNDASFLEIPLSRFGLNETIEISPAAIKDFCLSYQQNQGALNILRNNCYDFCREFYSMTMTER